MIEKQRQQLDSRNLVTRSHSFSKFCNSLLIINFDHDTFWTKILYEFHYVSKLGEWEHHVYINCVWVPSQVVMKWLISCSTRKYLMLSCGFLWWAIICMFQNIENIEHLLCLRLLETLGRLSWNHATSSSFFSLF